MILKPRLEDVKIVGYYLSKIIFGLGITMIVPILIGLAYWEINPILDFVIAIEIAFIFSLILRKLCYTDKDLNWMHGMAVVSLSWVVAALLGAIPLYLSGHWAGYLDACFDAMSGFATTGLALVQDLDHLSFTHNIWRHLTMFIGGQGIVIVALSFFVKGFSGAFKMYVGEAREERIMPNVIDTSRFIWLVSVVYLVLGTLVLGLIGVIDGQKLSSAFFHGACIFMAAFDTGGFTPNSQSILYYHSFLFEAVTVILMILGAINFKLHYHLWMGNRREIFRNLETRTFFTAIVVTFFIVCIGLFRFQVYPGAVILFRKGFYQFISAQTGTGYQTIYSSQFMGEWSVLSVFGIICAMALGGSICSTTGAIKMLRLSIIFKALVQDVKKIMLPERAVIVQKFHHIKDMILDDAQVRSAATMSLLYIGLYFLGAIVAVWLGYPFLSALFESTSAAANVGLSCGITNTAMPGILKIVYIIQMWAGRLEFMSIFTLLGVFVAVARGK